MTGAAARSAPIRVALVDDHALLLYALCEVLGRDGDMDVVLVHDGGGDVVDQVVAATPDVLLLDVRLADGDSLDLLAGITARLPTVAVVMLSAVGDPRVVASAFERGAVGYLTKGAPLSDVRAAIRNASQGRTVLPRQRLTDVVHALTADEAHERRLGAFLTARERSVLSRLAAGHPTSRIASDLRITNHTVRTHIQNILTKLGAHSKLEAAAIGIRAQIVTPYEGP
jgi:DNA-binding NarL/FixJ family response regulator